MPVVGVSDVGVAMTLTREAQPMAMATGEQAEEGASGAPVAGAAQPVMSSTSWAEARFRLPREHRSIFDK